jgi:hypothetical protein
MIDFLRLSAAALVITVLMELGVALLFGLRCKTELWGIVLINVVTNPLLNYFLAVNGYLHLFSHQGVLVLCLEVAVVLAEWRLLLWVLRQGATKMLALAVSMNACSYLAGLLLLR